MIRSVLVFGGGSAGFLAALTLKQRLPNLPVTLLKSKDLAAIQDGEGSTTTFGYHLHNYCGFDVKTFYRLAQPLWKIGSRFLWGPRPYFNFVFGFELDTQYHLLRRGTGYCLDNNDSFENAGLQSRLMHENKVWLRQPDGSPRLNADEFAYQVENDKLNGYFEQMAGQRGIPVIDEAAVEVLQDEHGVAGLRLESGRTITAELFVDASGSAARLLSQVLKEPFYSYKDSLFCDRVITGSWERGDEPIQPYTSAETMDAGWCWRIEHEHRINRGYVYCSSFISDNDAEAEFRAQNPKVQATRIVPFRSGRFERFWVKNVVAIGDAAAFVEPLEGTALASICLQCQALADTLVDCDLEPGGSTIFNCNRQVLRNFDAIRDFLSVHYRFNSRRDTPFWQECRQNVQLHWANRLVDFYRENGPSVLWRRTLSDETDWREFGMEGYLALLVGQCVPYHCNCTPSEQDRQNWANIQNAMRNKVASALTVPESLALVRSERWVWPERLYDKALAARP